MEPVARIPTVPPAIRAAGDDRGVAYNFLASDRDQQYLMPPSVRDWLPEGHLAWFVLDVVGALDLSAFHGRYRPDGRGGAAYDPAVMVALLVYAYCVGDRSSRLVERRLAEDVAYRVVAANAVPDHATVARFRADHEEALGGLFSQVLSMCAAAGLVRVGVVALDGTKVEAAAAMAADKDDGRLRRAMEAEARRIIEEAKALDAAEDELYGEARGDELPPELADRSERLKRLRAARERLDAAQAERDAADAEQAARDAARRAAGRRTPGPKPKKDPSQKPLLVNTTDPDSRLMKVPGGFAQAYNAQAVATAEQVLVAAELTTAGVDVDQLEPMLAVAVANLEAAGVEEPVGMLLADAGYRSADNAGLDTGTELLIATGKARHLPTEAPAPSSRPGRRLRAGGDRARRAHRRRVRAGRSGRARREGSRHGDRPVALPRPRPSRRLAPRWRRRPATPSSPPRRPATWARSPHRRPPGDGGTPRHRGGPCPLPQAGGDHRAGVRPDQAERRVPALLATGPGGLRLRVEAGRSRPQSD